MSPRIGMGLAVAPWAVEPKTALGRVRQAMRAMETQGIHVIRLPERCTHGVQATAVGWERRKDIPHGVTPLGAVLLMHQPDPDPHDGLPCSAGAMALNVSEPWVAGLEDGWAGEVMDRQALGIHTGVLYQAGYAAGVRLWCETSVECPNCAHVRHVSEPDCSACAERPGAVR